MVDKIDVEQCNAKTRLKLSFFGGGEGLIHQDNLDVLLHGVLLSLLDPTPLNTGQLWQAQFCLPSLLLASRTNHQEPDLLQEAGGTVVLLSARHRHNHSRAVFNRNDTFNKNKLFESMLSILLYRLHHFTSVSTAATTYLPLGIMCGHEEDDDSNSWKVKARVI